MRLYLKSNLYEQNSLSRRLYKKRKEILMNDTSLQIKGDWNVIKGKLKKAYGDLTDDDLAYAKGQEDELLGRLQKKLGKTAAEVRNILNGSKR
jgi:uncharacterized protein YjbJ (UPF0337 family)